jgi:uncharacterized protein
MLAALAPEMVWIEAGGFPSTMTHRTPDASLNNVFMRLAAEWEAFTTVPQEYVSDARSAGAIIGTRMVQCAMW